MPRDAYISQFSLGAVGGFCNAQNLASTIGLGRPIDGKVVFYSSLFQAGVDRILVLEDDVQFLDCDRLPERRVHVRKFAEAASIRASLRLYFDHYMGAGWTTKGAESLPIMLLESFLGDLLTALHLDRPLLATASLPDLAALRVAMPLEILSPVQSLFDSIRSYDSAVAMPSNAVSKEQLDAIDDIMASPSYQDVEQVHKALASHPSSINKHLVQLEKASNALYWAWKDLLRMKSSIIRLAQHVPSILEALFGKGPSAISRPIIESLDHSLGQDTSVIL